MTAKNQLLTIVIFAVTCIAALLSHYKDRESYRCRTCRSSKHVIQWRLGSWSDASIPLSPKQERLEESRFFHDFFPAGHLHEWQYAQGSPYYFFGTSWGGCGIGRGRHTSDVFMWYESDDNFRAFLQRKLQVGALTRDAAVKLLSMPRSPESADEPLHKEHESLIDAFLTNERNQRW